MPSFRITYLDPDWRWVQEKCLEQSWRSTGLRLAVTCLGHLARIHGALDVEKVLPTLSKLRDDPNISGRVADALDDIKTYLASDFELE